MIWIILVVAGLGIYGMIWISRISYKEGKRNAINNNDYRLQRAGNDIVDLKIRINRINNEKQKWETRFDEMEIRWRESKRRREELRLEKLELEAKLSDALSQIQ